MIRLEHEALAFSLSSKFPLSANPAFAGGRAATEVFTQGDTGLRGWSGAAVRHSNLHRCGCDSPPLAASRPEYHQAALGRIVAAGGLQPPGGPRPGDRHDSRHGCRGRHSLFAHVAT